MRSAPRPTVFSRSVMAACAVVAVLTMSACSESAPEAPAPSATSTPVPTTPPPSAGPPDMLADGQVYDDLEYAAADPEESLGHLLDLHLPDGATTRVPLVIWTHGSGWLDENGRDETQLVADSLNPKGFAVAGVAVRSSDNVQFPGQVDDMKAAVRWLRANADRYGLDPQRFGVMGESSGAWTAVMAGLTGDVERLEGEVGEPGTSSAVQAVVGWYTPTNFLAMDDAMIDGCETLNETFGLDDCHADGSSPESLMLGCPLRECEETVARADPARYVSDADPPILLLHGRKDLIVPWDQSERLYQALRRGCRDVTFVTLPEAGHAVSTSALTQPQVKAGATMRSVADCGRERRQPVDLTAGTISDYFARHLAAPAP